MDEKRIRRYREKTEYLDQELKNLEEWTKDISISEIKEILPIREKYSIYHSFQICLEIISDLAAMTVKDLKILPKDDYLNIDRLEKNNVISNELAPKIKEANGLRNRIVHNYNGLIDGIALKVISNLVNNIAQFKEAINLWLQKKE